MKFLQSASRWIRPITGVALLIACGAPLEDSPYSDDSTGDEQLASQDENEFGSSEEALSASCGGSDDSNMLAAGLAVAIAKELGRWDVNTDFVVSNGKLALSTTGALHCGSNCPRIAALLAMQDDTTSTYPNHIPANFRANLTNWYGKQKATLTNLVATKLTRDEGIFQIRSKLTGKYIVPQNGSTSSGVVLEESDQYTGTTASQWRVKLNGTKRQLVNIKSGLCMDLASNTSGSTTIVQRACSGVKTQDFRLGLMNPGLLSIRSDYNLALIPQGGSYNNGTDIVQSTVTGALQEQWVFQPYGSGVHRDLTETINAVFSLKVAHTGYGLAISTSSTSDGVGVVQQPYNANDDRFHWYVTQVGTVNNQGSIQIQYQFENRRTGKCLDLDGSSPKRLIQRTCSTSYSQRFVLAPTGNLRNVAYTVNGKTVDVQNGSTSSGAALVEGSGNGWQMYNMITFEPILAIEPHRLSYSYTAANAAACGNYDWYQITQPNGMALADPASTWVQLIFAGGKQSATGKDINPYIAQQVNGNQVAIDPTYGLDESSQSSTGACSASCVAISVSKSLAGQCCSCNGLTKTFKKSTSNAITYLCQ
ncbi:MAG TPA: RICIN domain-containing protein [Polyangiaceae bacterium]|nr:RICIN domain-containing protein [Polyangiaceae bacterium]